MAKDDKEFGKWQGTLVVSGKLSVKRFEKGIITKEGMITERMRMPQGTKREDVTEIVNAYYLRQNQRRGKNEKTN